MSLVTRCPACATAFKVVPDQLRISEGWVRCGRCSHVFDATLHLRSGDESGADAALTGVPPTNRLAEGPATPSATDAIPSTPPDGGEVVGSDALPVPGAPTMDWPAPDMLDLGAAAKQTPVAEAAASIPQHQPDEAGATPTSAWLPLPTDLPAVVADEPWPVQDEHRALVAEPPLRAEAPQPSPVDEAVNAQLQKALRRTRIQALRETRARARAQANAADATAGKKTADSSQKRSSGRASTGSSTEAMPTRTLRQASEETPAPVIEAAPAPLPAMPAFLDVPAPSVEAPAPRRRVATVAFIALAAVALLLQVLRHERDGLAASQPAMRPVLAALCQLSGCELSAVRRIDAVRIDGSSFTPEREGGGYRLVFSLRNASPTALAMPAVELSLLDGNERPVVRRVFQPTEFGAPVVLGPRAQQAADLPVALRMPEDGSVPPVVGYSLLAFYP